MLPKIFRFLTLLLLALSLAGCGFHLRGQNVLPPRFHNVAISSVTPYGDFESTLRGSLTRLGAMVTRTCSAPTTIHILSAGLINDVPTIGGSNQARIYVYYYSVTFEVLDEQHHQIIPPQIVTASRTIIINAGTALESTGQLGISIHDMQVEASHMIINMLNAPTMFN